LIATLSTFIVIKSASLPGQAEWDAKRNQRLEELGYKILHLTNEDILTHPNCLLK
jgi:very-short-patch-repair endonuclease